MYKTYISDFLIFWKLTELCRFVTYLWNDPRRLNGFSYDLKSGLICRFVTVHAFDRNTDRRTDGRTEYSSLGRFCIPCSRKKRVSCYNIVLRLLLPAITVNCFTDRTFPALLPFGENMGDRVVRAGDNVFSPAINIAPSRLMFFNITRNTVYVRLSRYFSVFESVFYFAFFGKKLSPSHSLFCSVYGKRDQNVFYNILYRTRAILTKFGG